MPFVHGVLLLVMLVSCSRPMIIHGYLCDKYWIRNGLLKHSVLQKSSTLRRSTLRWAASNEENNIVNSDDGSSLGSYFEEKIQRLRFGYEKMPAVAIETVSLNDIEEDTSKSTIASISNLKRSPLRLAKLLPDDAIESPRALCFTENTRPRGCEPLLLTSNSDKVTSSVRKTVVSRSSQPYDVLPCVANGICPYIKFRCARGHEWKAIPNSPVCMYCPQCKTSKTQIQGIRRPTNDDIIEQCNEYASGRQGHVASVYFNRRNIWKSKVQLRCQNNHSWISNPTNLLKGNTWCRYCLDVTKSLSIDDLHATASHFGGNFLGFGDEIELTNARAGVSLSQARWRCKVGHVFVMPPNNIRRSPGSQRKCSWCRICRKDGKQFIWDPK